jgi:hypothetical protein
MQADLTAVNTGQSLTKFAALAAGDYVEAEVFHTTGAPLNINSNRGFELTWVAPGP